MSRTESGKAGGSFAERLTPLLAAAGVTPVPTLLLRYQSLLDLSAQAVLLAIWVLSKKWTADWPYLSLEEVAAGVGRDRSKVKAWKQELVRKGYLKAIPRSVPGLGRRADQWDLSGLFAALERLYLTEQSQAALDKVRLELPEPAYPLAGLSTVPTVSTGRRGKIASSRRGENGPARRGEFAPSVGAKSARRGGAKTPPEKEAGLRDPDQGDSQRTQPERPAHGEAAMPRSGEDEPTRRRALTQRLLRQHPEHAEALAELERRLSGPGDEATG